QGVGSSWPLALATRIRPSRSAMNRRPSGAKSSDQTTFSPVTYGVTEIPSGFRTSTSSGTGGRSPLSGGGRAGAAAGGGPPAGGPPAGGPPAGGPGWANMVVADSARAAATPREIPPSRIEAPEFMKYLLTDGFGELTSRRIARLEI